MTDKPEPNKEYALTGKSGDACIANGSSWKESEVKKKPETCNEQLERMVKNIALDITEGEPGTACDYIDNVYDIEWITHQDHSYKAARLLVAGGGPNIWVLLWDCPDECRLCSSSVCISINKFCPQPRNVFTSKPKNYMISEMRADFSQRVRMGGKFNLP
mgnify:CR=1 FL=1